MYGRAYVERALQPAAISAAAYAAVQQSHHLCWASKLGRRTEGLTEQTVAHVTAQRPTVLLLNLETSESLCVSQGLIVGPLA